MAKKYDNFKQLVDSISDSKNFRDNVKKEVTSPQAKKNAATRT